MAIDYSEMRIGPPQEVIADITRRLGEINFNSANLKVGVADNPCQARGAQGGEQSWPLMKMLYLTHSLAQAQEMAELLRAWDAKLFLDTDWAAEQPSRATGDQSLSRRRARHAPGRHSVSFYAFALVR